jgi:anti-anti-sigma factor
MAKLSPWSKRALILSNRSFSLNLCKEIQGVFIPRWFKSVCDLLVSSASIKSTFLSVSTALWEISPRLPIGVATNYFIIVLKEVLIMRVELREKDGVTLIDLSGALDYESLDRFRKGIDAFLNNEKIRVNKKVIINMCKLDFFGSTGLTEFVTAMKELRVKHLNLKYCGVDSSFKKIMKYNEHSDSDFIFDSEEDAVRSFA